MKRSVIALVLLCLVAVIFLSSMSSQTSAEGYQGTSLLTRVERLETKLSDIETKLSEIESKLNPIHERIQIDRNNTRIVAGDIQWNFLTDQGFFSQINGGANRIDYSGRISHFSVDEVINVEKPMINGTVKGRIGPKGNHILAAWGVLKDNIGQGVVNGLSAEVENTFVNTKIKIADNKTGSERVEWHVLYYDITAQ